MRFFQSSLVIVVAGSLGLAACSSGKDLSTLPSSIPGAGPTTTVPSDGPTPPCDDDPGVGGTVPDGAAAGDLVDATKLDDSRGDSTGYPNDASVWRILYVSTGIDESDVQLVCGLAAAPSKGPTAVLGAGRMVAWAHGTIGLQQACQPSSEPETAFWAPTPEGIGAISWGAALAERKGDPSDGVLQTALDRGWVVSATDYQPNDTYIIGRIAAANVIDAGRATTQLMDREFGAESTPDSYDTITWGHSQGGHAALFAGQLFDTYQAATPSPRSADLTLRGVAAEAPASNLIVQPDLQPDIDLGNGLADWEMHKTIELVSLPIPLLELQIGPALMAYFFGAWAQFSQRGTPPADADTPAFPREAASLDLDAVATDQGALTIARMQALCLSNSDATTVKTLTDPYRDAKTNAMLTPEMWNLPDDYSTGQFFHGGADRTCATTNDAATESWCSWIRWNIPGPFGSNPFPKVPMNGDEPVPVLIAQGANDEVVHCSPADGEDGSKPPSASNCMSVALFEALRDNAYCPSSGDQGFLRLSLVRKDGFGSPGSHLSIPGQIAANGYAKSDTDLTFDGSPVDEFITASFDGSLKPSCSVSVLNPS